MKINAFLVFSALFVTSASADLRMLVVCDSLESKVSFSGMKKRSDSNNPLLGSKTSSVVRADRGIECTWDDEMKAYQEKSLVPESHGDDDADGKPSIQKTSGSKTVAGFRAEGYKLKLPNNDVYTLWVATSGDVLDQASLEIGGFQSAVLIKRGESIKDQTSILLGFFSEQYARRLKAVGPLPKGFPVALQKMSGSSAESVFEIKSISVDSIQPDEFAVPNGYRKVNSLMEEQIRGMQGS